MKGTGKQSSFPGLTPKTKETQIETDGIDVGRKNVKAAEFGAFQKNFPQDVLVEVKN
mgnify:CR=1 FL=1